MFTAFLMWINMIELLIKYWLQGVQQTHLQRNNDEKIRCRLRKGQRTELPPISCRRITQKVSCRCTLKRSGEQKLLEKTVARLTVLTLARCHATQTTCWESWEWRSGSDSCLECIWHLGWKLNRVSPNIETLEGDLEVGSEA